MKKEMKNKFSWKNYTFYLKSEAVLSEKLINVAVTNFFDVEVSKLTSNQHIVVLFRVVTPDNIHKTLGPLKLLNKDDLEYYKTHIGNILAYKMSGYDDVEITKIRFSFGVREGLAPENTKEISEGKSIVQNYKHYKLPITMDPLGYGNPLNVFNLSDSVTVYWIQANNGNAFNIKTSINPETGLKVNNVEAFRHGLLTLTYEDTQLEGSKIMRTINNNIYYYDAEGNLEFFYVQKPTKYISTLQEHGKLDSDFIALDLETRLVKGRRASD